MTLFVDDPDFKLYVGDVREQLRALADDSIHCVVTSPPYWGLRDYGTGSWEGGDPECDHAIPTTTMNVGFNERWGQGAGDRKQEKKSEGQYAHTCPKCGAQRTDSQIGLEPTPQEFVASLVEVFREVRRVLRPDGTCWLNLGDTYAGGGGGNYGSGLSVRSHKTHPTGGKDKPRAVEGLKPRDLVGIPWRVAFALQEDGWWLRSDIIWAKPNPMPESVTNRPTKAHEYLFLLTKRPDYFYDADAIREPFGDNTHPRSRPGEEPSIGKSVGHGSGIKSNDSFLKATGGSLLPETPPQAETLDGMPPETPRGPDGRRKTIHDHGVDNSHENYANMGGTQERWPGMRPQQMRALELARAAGLTDAHFDAIRAVGVTDAGKAQVTQKGYGKSSPEVLRLAAEAKEVLGGYFREFLTPLAGRNARTVWTIATESYKEAHFATFPQKLVEPCVKAGTSEHGVCSACGTPWAREEQPIQTGDTQKMGDGWATHEGRHGEIHRDGREPGKRDQPVTASVTVGWYPLCTCGGADLTPILSPLGYDGGDDPTLETGRAGFDRPRAEDAGVRRITRHEQAGYAKQLKKSPARPEMEEQAGDAFKHYIRTDPSGARPIPEMFLEWWVGRGWLTRVTAPPKSAWPPVLPATVLDPFMGSGTTALVARRLGRSSVGVELNEEYAGLAAKRLSQLSLFAPLISDMP